MRVNAHWIKHFFFWDHYYIIPNTDFVVLGGTKQKDDWNLNIDENDRKDIKSGCEALIPSLCNAKLISEHVGLRPGRSAPRVDREVKTFGVKQCHIIHNYGHGGSGITLSWGCAEETLQLLKECLQ
ncbi:D-aspartate oxidase-like protein [Leptotrombidium deliense]|uniref:D-aspartate oxidase-like protein n=1 Tax=Leptotrombidium deliense TaxID=299467 RepID=A0A443SAH9_9ACAR|nr:D-aspartate oxidase-like protein [Leptotrombidium deliense]